MNSARMDNSRIDSARISGPAEMVIFSDPARAGLRGGDG